MFYLGEAPQPAEPATNVLVAEWQKQADCICRGGVWHSGVPGQGYCIPGTQPTNKYYDVDAKSCMPISATPPGQVHDVKEGSAKPLYGSKNWIWWAVGIGVAVVALPLVVRAVKKRRKGKA